MIAIIASAIAGFVAGVVSTFLFSRRNPKTVATVDKVVTTVTGNTK